MINTNQLVDLAKSAFDRADYDEALRLYELSLEAAPSDLSPHYVIAHIYERGLSSKGIDLVTAMSHYLRVAEAGDSVGVFGHLGVARVIFRSGNHALRGEAISHCLKAIDIDDAPQARMLLGAIYEYWDNRPVDAREQFLLAFRKKLAWGMRFYARSLMRSGNPLRGSLAHVLATIVGPIYKLRFGERSPFG